MKRYQLIVLITLMVIAGFWGWQKVTNVTKSGSECFTDMECQNLFGGEVILGAENEDYQLDVVEGSQK